MRDMPLPFELEGKGGVGFLHNFCREFSQTGGGCGGGLAAGDWRKLEACFEVSGGGGVCEPRSVLEAKGSPSPFSGSTTTLSSSLAGAGAGGGGSSDTAGVATVSGNPSEKWPLGHPHHHQETSTDNSGSNSNNGESTAGQMVKKDEWVNLDMFQQIPTNLDAATGVEKCGMEYWDSDLLEPAAASPGQDHSIMRLIMGDSEYPPMALNKLLQGSGPGNPNPDFQFGGGGFVDQGFGLDQIGSSLTSSMSKGNDPPMLGNFPTQNHNSLMFDEKSNPHFLISQLQAQNLQNPAFFLPLPQNQLEQHLPLPPPPKRHNPGFTGDTTRLHMLPAKPKMAGDEVMIQQQAIVEQLQKAAELIEAGNLILAQEILARLNHQLSPIGKPFYRAAFYFKEALMNTPLNSSPSSPYNLFFRIGAYKSFSEISPLVQFANFTSNQAVLEALEGFHQIRIVDFDIGYGGQWASLMQELALRKGGAPSVKITAFASPSTHDQLELGLARENLIHFAQEMKMSFDFEIVNLDYLNSASSWSLPFHDHEGVAVNLPISSLSNGHVSPSMILRFIKQLSPKITVSVDRGCDRTDLPFPQHIHQAFLSYLVLLESLEAVNINLDGLQKIETFLIRPEIEKLISSRRASTPEKMQHWKNLLISSGFAPISFSNFTECQAEWLLKRTMARGFHVEKRQSSLVLCWQRKELISASAWRC